MLTRYLSVAVPLLIADAIWLGLIARTLYARELGALMAPEIRKLPAALFYLGYPALLLVLIVMPLRELGAPPARIALNSALFGLAAYGTYDLVNLATLKNWPLKLTIIDIAWGVTVTTFAALASVALLG